MAVSRDYALARTSVSTTPSEASSGMDRLDGCVERSAVLRHVKCFHRGGDEGAAARNAVGAGAGLRAAGTSDLTIWVALLLDDRIEVSAV